MSFPDPDLPEFLTKSHNFQTKASGKFLRFQHPLQGKNINTNAM